MNTPNDALARAHEWQAHIKPCTTVAPRRLTDDLIAEVERLTSLELELRLEIAISVKRIQILKNPNYYQELGDRMRAMVYR